MSRGIVSLRGYQEGGPTGDPWPISGTPTEWTPEKIRKLNEVFSRLLEVPLLSQHDYALRQEERDRHLALVDSLQEITKDFLGGWGTDPHRGSPDVAEKPGWYPEFLKQTHIRRATQAGPKAPHTDVHYGFRSPNRGLRGFYQPGWGQMSVGDTALANKYDPHDRWNRPLGIFDERAEEYNIRWPEKSYEDIRGTLMHEFGHVYDPEGLVFGDLAGERGVLMDEREVPIKNLRKQIIDEYRDPDSQRPRQRGQYFADAFKRAVQFLNSPESREKGVSLSSIGEEWVEPYGSPITLVKELLKLPIYQHHPLNLTHMSLESRLRR